MSAIDLNDADLQVILQFTIELAKKAGKLMLEGSQAIQTAGQSDINEKKNAVDLVTEYDVKVEELVQGEIKAKYPNFGFIGEESYSAGQRPPLTDAPTYCVDPIDGTTNFIHGFPYACISLGLIYMKRPVLGVIYNPFLDQMYTGLKSHGSYLTQGGRPPQRLPLSGKSKPLPSLSQALIAVEWGSDRIERTITSKANSFGRLAGDSAKGVQGGKMAHSLRSLGSAALNYAMVAQGGQDLYWEIGCWPWDVCAGIVIAQEADCLVTGSHEAFAASKDTEAFGDITEEILTGRKYLVIRGIAPEEGESALDAQRRIISEFYETVEDVPTN